MSTHIEHGYRLKSGIEPFAFISRVREVMDPARDAADAKLLANLYVEAIDELWFRGETIPEQAGYTAWREWYLEQQKLSPTSRSHDPNEFGVQIGQDPLTGDYYLLAIAYNADLRNAFDAMDEIEEYGYWNSTDSYPEGVTREDWEVREALWDRIIPNRGRSNMMTFALRHPSDGGVRRLLGLDGEDTSPVFAALPAAEERSLTVGGNAYTSYLHNEHGIDPWTAAQHVVFGRSKQLSIVTDMVTPYLPAITPELVTEGSHGTVIDPGYPAALKAACDKLYALDKEKLASR